MKVNNEKRVNVLKKRVERCVCKSCGGPLSLRKIDFNDFEDARIEIFCEHCNRMDFGIEPEIFTSAQYYVDEYKINLYPDMGNNNVTRKMTVSSICDIMTWGFKNLGFLTKEGFTVKPSMDGKIVGECVVLNDETLDELEKELEL